MDDVSVLVNMGFPRVQAAEMLDLAGGDLDGAVMLLTSMPAPAPAAPAPPAAAAAAPAAAAGTVAPQPAAERVDASAVLSGGAAAAAAGSAATRTAEHEPCAPALPSVDRAEGGRTSAATAADDPEPERVGLAAAGGAPSPPAVTCMRPDQLVHKLRARCWGPRDAFNAH